MVAPGDRIDAHRHYWDSARVDYPWMPDSGVLARPYLPADAAPSDASLGIEGCVVVQAAPTLAESQFLLGLADANEHIRGVVGWVDLEGDVVAQLDQIRHPRLVGVRPMVQDIPDDEWIARPTVVAGIRALEAAGIPLEVVLYTRHLAPLLAALDQVPGIPVIIDHLAKPNYAVIEPAWEAGMRALAQRQTATIKLSGMVTEVTQAPHAELFRAHTELALDLFGADRCMVGSDWPVSLLALPFEATSTVLDELVAPLTQSERDAVLAGTARRVYGL